MKNVFLLGTTFLISNFIFSQPQKTSVAVFPFVYAMPEYRSKASQIQGMVVDLFSKKSNINIIDRSKDTLLMKELDNQIREQSMASKTLVEQGKVMGAQVMIVGTVSNVKVDEIKSTVVIASPGSSTISYKAFVTFSLQLIDVESGKIVQQKSFDNKEAKTKWDDMLKAQLARSPEAALSVAMKVTQRSIMDWLNQSYPPDIKILKIEDRDKKGFPATILVTGIDAALEKGAKLSLNEIEILDAGDGKKLKRTKNIADLKVSEIQGDITVCKVTNGEKTIEGKMNSGAKLEVLVN